MKKEPKAVIFCHTPASCLSCERCRKVCPAGINIPQVLKLYGEYQSLDKKKLAKLYSMDSCGQPIDCIECGRCSAHCPQGIDVAEAVRKLAMLQACLPAIADSENS